MSTKRKEAPLASSSKKKPARKRGRVTSSQGKTEQKHTCSTCGYSTGRKSDLKKHERIHLGIKPFVCKVCNRSFTQSSHLRVHAKVHEVELYTCYLCGQTYRSFGYLVRHKQTHLQKMSPAELSNAEQAEAKKRAPKAAASTSSGPSRNITAMVPVAPSAGQEAATAAAVAPSRPVQFVPYDHDAFGTGQPPARGLTQASRPPGSTAYTATPARSPAFEKDQASSLPSSNLSPASARSKIKTETIKVPKPYPPPAPRPPTPPYRPGAMYSRSPSPLVGHFDSPSSNHFPPMFPSAPIPTGAVKPRVAVASPQQSNNVAKKNSSEPSTKKIKTEPASSESESESRFHFKPPPLRSDRDTDTELSKLASARFLPSVPLNPRPFSPSMFFVESIRGRSTTPYSAGGRITPTASPSGRLTPVEDLLSSRDTPTRFLS